jgi:uncharacterized Tic20 family protein
MQKNDLHQNTSFLSLKNVLGFDIISMKKRGMVQMNKMQGKSILSFSVYAVLIVLLVVTMVLTLGSAFSADFARNLERFMIRDLGWFDFDLFTMGQYAMVGLTILTVGLLVLGDELQIRRARKVRR